ESEPHEARSSIGDDVFEVLKFISYIADQEEAEYRFVKRRRSGCLREYRTIASGQPVSWKLLRSVCMRTNQLYERRRELFSRKSRVSIAEIGRFFAELRATIIDRGDKDLICPPVPLADRALVHLSWGDGERAARHPIEPRRSGPPNVEPGGPEDVPP